MTVTASRLAPRLMVKEPAIGQDSTRTSVRIASVGNLPEVILISGDFLNLALAGREQVWLARDQPGKARRVGTFLSFGSWGDQVKEPQT
jgi:hypothetical protein